MSGKRVLALYAAVLLGFAVVLCRLYFLAENHTYAARAEAQSTVRLSLPARRGSFCVQFAGSGHYFDDHADALAYLCKRWRGSFITKHLEDACALAATRQPAALVAARKRARMWKIMENSGGDKP